MIRLRTSLLNNLRLRLRCWLEVPDGNTVAEELDRLEERLGRLETRIATCERHHQVFGPIGASLFGRRNP